jgi:general nucleoside transport system permease protein
MRTKNQNSILRWNTYQFFLNTISIWAIIIALFFGGILISLSGISPITAYYELFRGAFSDFYGINTTIVKSIPLIFTGLAVSLAFKGGFFNVGVEGQLYFGGLGATLAGLYIVGMPAVVHIPLTLLIAMIFGGFWALIPAVLKMRFNINEIITCLFLHFIALLFVESLITGPLFQPGSPAPMSPLIQDTAILPIIIEDSDIHLGLILALALVVILYFTFNNTTIGFKISAIGYNADNSRYSGMNVIRDSIFLAVFSGGIAGLAGAVEIMGVKHRLFEAFSPGYGWDGIVIGFLARNNPLGVLVAALFFGALRSGAGTMQRSTGVPTTAVQAIQGLVILFVALGLAIQQRQSKP